jgi:hypothetical protein
MHVAGHLIATFFRAIFRIFLTAIVCGILGAGVTLLLAFSKTGHLAPDLMTTIAAIAVGILSLYAGGITVLMSEAVHALQEAAKDVGKDAGSALKGAAVVAQEIEKHL